MGHHSQVKIDHGAVQRLVEQAAERMKPQLQAKWDAFVAEAKGKPEAEIRALVACTFDRGELSDEAVAALARGEDVALKIEVRG